MTHDRSQRLSALAILALSLACADLWVKVIVPTPDWALHQRSGLWVLASTLLLVATVPLTRLPSTAITLGSGFFAGGILGNLISAGTDHLEVPNPILLMSRNGGGVAFNLADTFILTGNLILMVGICAFAIRHRDRLPRYGSRRTWAAERRRSRR